MSNLDHYVVLGVPRIADAAMIRAAYVALAKRYHPDIATGDAVLAAANFRQITEAYETLSDPDRRAAYDSKIVTAVQRIAPPPEYLQYVAARNRRRKIVGVSAVAATFLVLVGFLVVRALSPPSLEAMAFEPPRAAEEPPPAETEAARPRPMILLGSQPSQPGRLQPSGPVGAGTGARVLRAPPIEASSGQSLCVSDDGVRFAIVNRNGSISVLYNNADAVRPSIQYAGRSMVLLTNIVSNDSVMISLTRGEEGGTLLFHADAAGNFRKPVGARCEGLAY
jgi:plasmid stabilization system protein ParE